MKLAQILGAFAFAAVLSAAVAQANDAAAPAAAAPAAAVATEKCEITKDGKTTTTEVAVGSCEKEGGKVVAAEAPKAEEKK